MVVHMRHTRSHTANRRSHHFIKGKALSTCPKCGVQKLPHTMCANCGTYKGRAVFDVLAKTVQKEKKQKAKADGK